MFNLREGENFYDGFSNIFLLSELSNYLFTILVLMLFIAFKLIPKKFYLIWAFFLATPFFLNYVLFDPWYLPDQFGYMQALNNIERDGIDLRSFMTSNRIAGIDVVMLSAGILSLVPIFSTLTITAGGFITKLIALVFYSFLYKHLNKILLSLTLLVPSLILYSSLALREFILIAITTIFLINVIKKNYFFAMLILIPIYLLKIQLIPSMLFIFFIRLLAIHKSYSRIFIFLTILLLISIATFDFYYPILNFYKLAFFLEDGGDLASYYFIEENSLSYIGFLEELLKSFLKFSIQPLPFQAGGILSLVLFFENLVIISVIAMLSIRFSKKDELKKRFIILLILSMLVTLLIYSFTTYNIGTFSRYRFTAMMPFIFSLIFLNTKKNVFYP